MSISAHLIDQRVEGVVERLQDRLKTEARIGSHPDKLKSAAFVFLVSQALLGLDDEEALEGLVDGGGDFGIDGIFFGKPDDGDFPVVLIQGKYKRSLEGTGSFPEGGIEKMFGAIRTIFNPSATYSANDRLMKRVEEVRSLIREGNIPSIRVVLCNNGRKWNSICQQRVQNFGYRDMVLWEYAGPDELITFLRRKKDVQTNLKLTGRALVEDYAFMRAMVGRMSVTELAHLFDDHGDVLLDRNIRRYLGLSARPNEKIAATLKDPQQRDNFYFFNNGITIVCTKFSYNALADKDWIVQVSGLQIVNGGQTSKTIQQVQKEIGPEIGTAQVLVRIYELPTDNEELAQRITEATNSQSPVDFRDLRSNDKKQKNLSDSISELGFSYRRQRSDTTSGAADITSTSAAEAVLAIWRHRPHSARFAAAEHFGKLYDVIFTDDLNGAQVVAAVLLLRFAENKRKRPPPNSPDFLQYGSRFVAMVMGGYLLEDLSITLQELNHRNFPMARDCIATKSEDYYNRAMARIAEELKLEFGAVELTLQKLSATFRRVDLVERLRDGKTISLQMPLW